MKNFFRTLWWRIARRHTGVDLYLVTVRGIPMRFNDVQGVWAPSDDGIPVVAGEVIGYANVPETVPIYAPDSGRLYVLTR